MHNKDDFKIVVVSSHAKNLEPLKNVGSHSLIRDWEEQIAVKWFKKKLTLPYFKNRTDTVTFTFRA